MKVKVLQSFRDKDNFSKVYNIGEVIDIDGGRAEHLISIKVVEKAGHSKKSE